MQPVARVGDTVTCPACIHTPDGVTPVPLPVVGNIVSGSTKTFVFGQPLAREGDTGIHAACLGRQTFEIKGSGYSSKTRDLGKKVARLGDPTQHCGGLGPPGIAPMAYQTDSSPGTISTGAFTVLSD